MIIRNSRGKVVPVQGEDVHVCAERIPDVGSAPLETPVVTINQLLSVSGSELSFILPELYHSDAYRLAIGPSSLCQGNQ